MSKIRHGYSFTEYSPLEAVKKSKTPTLFIHGSQDTYVPTYMCQELYDAAVCPKDIIHIAGAEHADLWHRARQRHQRSLPQAIMSNGSS